MSGATSKADLVAAAATKWMRAIIDGYSGPPEGLRAYLLRQLAQRDRRADAILASIIDEIL